MHTPFHRCRMSCYIPPVTPVKRDRAWTPVYTHSATKAAVPAMECGFVVRAPFMVARQAGASLAGSRKSVSGSPTCRATALIGLRAVVSANHTLLEAILATLPRAIASASPTSGTPDPIQLHAQAHNSLAMACYYLRQPAPNAIAARRQAVRALNALRNLSATLEG